MRNLWWAALMVGCTAPEVAAPELVDGVASRIPEGSPEALGVLGFLNDGDTTLELLDGPVGLDRRAATALIEHRDGPDGVWGSSDDDPYDTIAEVDAQYFVGDSALDRLLSYASANGWVPGPDDVIGSWEGVSFTTQQVTLVLDLVNTASQETLDDDVGLDRRAAEGIVEQRPFSDIGTLAAVPYVGPSALVDLQDFASANALAGVGEDCLTDGECQPDLRCAGAVAWGSGLFCTDTWGVFSYEGPATIPDDGTELATSVDVQGLASVPIDVVLTLDLDHPRPADLQLSIDNFNGYGTTLWSGGDASPSLEMVVYAFPSDDEVHGTYTVRLTDTVSGEQGTLNGWDLLVVSIYD